MTVETTTEPKRRDRKLVCFGPTEFVVGSVGLNCNQWSGHFQIASFCVFPVVGCLQRLQRTDQVIPFYSKPEDKREVLFIHRAHRLMIIPQSKVLTSPETRYYSTGLGGRQSHDYPCDLPAFHCCGNSCWVGSLCFQVSKGACSVSFRSGDVFRGHMGMCSSDGACEQQPS